MTLNINRVLLQEKKQDERASNCIECLMIWEYLYFVNLCFIVLLFIYAAALPGWRSSLGCGCDEDMTPKGMIAISSSIGFAEDK